ncbi:GNAT family N-acetyltransferase [Wohlfahrtiimonas chitiniclastica]|uniref:GNAT family N-acetyltransferase n=1 Tax=Wohlfahrtiimonas chitiniclastica TaxID=400946 RepID=UPI001BCF3F2A|nr:GNAT family N-acetyltransferase [Wohlfahrtiimonas chitiniclastica]MBS7816889.1 GNAT family N-acetyltransferase [Wohlfahrtiimonas chitiniclastica]MBS7822218.1 GNAT family N-acetyltransferase [Wohlfahrtiimonas chitiniclastica]MBS7830280.1 GNAT family N-acetyltransferase [Wohlfahrtiimonas chitiniclastica]MBS7832248.1 GNAT family N-acetyltransferase [Wohlfahrtiimonas chitiniclastica]
MTVQYLTQLEPDSLIKAFEQSPPYHFLVQTDVPNVPAFRAPFNLLTTLEADALKKIARLPLQKLIHRTLTWQTTFIGTTVSEYCLISDDDATQTARTIRAAYGQKTALTIVKDIPNQSPLLSDEANQKAAELKAALMAENFITLSGQALAWVPIDFKNSEEYIARLSKSRRKDMRRKLKSLADIEIREIKTGDAIFQDDAILNEYYDLYLNVFNQSEIHFDQLSREFFKTILQDAQSGGIIFTYHHNDQLIGYNICYVLNQRLVDKYVGFVYPAAREHNLYYLSWFYNLDYAAQHQLTHYIAGWTDPQIKAYLGAQFTFTEHAVYIKNPILRAILSRLSRYFESDQKTLDQLNQENA